MSQNCKKCLEGVNTSHLYIPFSNSRSRFWDFIDTSKPFQTHKLMISNENQKRKPKGTAYFVVMIVRGEGILLQLWKYLKSCFIVKLNRSNLNTKTNSIVKKHNANIFKLKWNIFYNWSFYLQFCKWTSFIY